MSLKEKLQIDLKKAMQAKDRDMLSVLRLLLAAVLTKEKEKRVKLSKTEKDPDKLEKLSVLSDEEILSVVSSEIKKRKDSIEQYGKGGRQDLVKQEKKELDILTHYQPEQMSEEEIREIVRGKIKELNLVNLKDKGQVMGQVMGQLKGRAEGRLVDKIVQEELQD